MKRIGIYIHIPFCKRECFYCHFVKREYDKNLVEKYVTALQKEMGLRTNGDYVVDTVYIGGGSPSLLNERQFAAIAGSLNEHFSIDDDIEFTVEANPEDVSGDKLKALKDMGINRLSIGTQSFCAPDLSYLKRTHDARQSLAAVEKALESGFNNINIDFIISLPTQKDERLAENFAYLETFDIPHVSAYILEDVDWGPGKNEKDNELYFFTVDSLAALGYRHYEVSNFCKKGFHSRHNLKYWNNEDYIGMGLSASGYEEGKDYKNVDSFNEYFARLEAGELPVGEVTENDAGLRRIVMGLRLLEGTKEEYFQNYEEQLEFLLSNGILQSRGNKIAVNPAKILLLNEILTYFH